MKVITWMGGSKDALVAFPPDVRRKAGYQQIRCIGVREIRIRDETGAFRVVYLASRPEGIYVLHCFQKKTRRTAKRDLDLARHRFQAISHRSE